jgi:hypothetical protein
VVMSNKSTLGGWVGSGERQHNKKYEREFCCCLYHLGGALVLTALPAVSGGCVGRMIEPISCRGQSVCTTLLLCKSWLM